MKRYLLITLVLILSIGVTGCNESEETDQKAETVELVAEVELDRKGELEKAIVDRVEEGDYRKVSIDKITINDDLGNGEEGNHIVLAYLVFGVQNKEKTANEMMRMYSDDLVATLANQGIEDISEATVFWEDEYNNRKLKYSYKYSDKGFYLTDSME